MYTFHLVSSESEMVHVPNFEILVHLTWNDPDGFSKKIMFGANGSFKTQNGASSQLWIRCKDCFTMLHNERGKERHGNYINGFSKKNWFGAVWSFWPKNVRSHNLGSTSGIFKKFCIMKGAKRYMKQSGRDFSGKRLCDGYFMDIMWCLCVQVKIQQRVEWFCEKASLRICNLCWRLST